MFSLSRWGGGASVHIGGDEGVCVCTFGDGVCLVLARKESVVRVEGETNL